MKERGEPKGSQSEKLLELTRESVRKQALELFKYTKTCMLARELCFFIRTQRALLEKEDVKDCCSFVSNLCREGGCGEASELCARAAEAVVGSEKTYLELCGQSMQRCSELRRPGRKPPEGATYVA